MNDRDSALGARDQTDYHFVTSWRVPGTCGEVADILGDPLRLAVWWPSVYLRVEEIEPAQTDNGVGRRVRLLTKGWLPYTLQWDFVVLDSQYPHRSTIAATGDFEGTGVWTFRQDGDRVDITYDWRIRATKPLLRNLSLLLRPLFEANHRWAMAQGEESLVLEMARRAASSDSAAAGADDARRRGAARRGGGGCCRGCVSGLSIYFSRSIFIDFSARCQPTVTTS
jgi:hypothetical protein